MFPEKVKAKKILKAKKPMLVQDDVVSNKSGGAMPEEEYKPRTVNINTHKDYEMLKNIPKGTYLHAHT